MPLNHKIAIGDIILENKKTKAVSKVLNITPEGVRGTKKRGLRIMEHKLKGGNVEMSDF